MRIGLFFAVAAVAFAVSAAEGPTLAPGPANGGGGGGDECTNLLLNLQDCLDYVTEGSTAKKPTSSCCGGLKTVLTSNAKCLCQGFGVAKQAGISIDMEKASALPASCALSTNAAPCSLSPAGAPNAAVSPSASSPTSPQTISPAAAPDASSVSKSAFSLSAGPLLAALVLVVAAYFSSF